MIDSNYSRSWEHTSLVPCSILSQKLCAQLMDVRKQTMKLFSSRLGLVPLIAKKGLLVAFFRSLLNLFAI